MADDEQCSVNIETFNRKVRKKDVEKRILEMPPKENAMESIVRVVATSKKKMPEIGEWVYDTDSMQSSQ